jgi:RHH-type rel operon transcriptional repressor/antitoxin RelB
MNLTALRIPIGLERNITKIAKETKRSKSFIIREAIESYLEDYGDYKLAMKRLNAVNDIPVPFEEARKRLGV